MTNGFKLGPITIHTYGLLIIAGTLLAVGIMILRARRKGLSLEFLLDALPWVLIGSVIGARLWHIFTPPLSMEARGITTRYYLTHLNEALAIWKGGVGILGALGGGLIALALFARRKQQPLLIWLDLIAPGLALAQAVGRWGNFVNQEVYGLPTRLPWAIFIEPQFRISGYEEIAFYHPLFFYESVLSIINLGLLLILEKKFPFFRKPGNLFMLYLLIYGTGRTGLEFLRLDVSLKAGVNVNQFIAALLALAAAVWLYLSSRPNYHQKLNTNDTN